MSKRYEIEKITDILQVPEESFDKFLVDLSTYYHLGKHMTTLIDEVAAVGGIKVKTVPQKFTWIDDGKHNATVSLTSKHNTSKE